MLAFLGTIATSLAVNLIYDKKIQKDEKSKIARIQTSMSDFNRKYDNTVLDTNAFQQFLDSTERIKEIYNAVFEEGISTEKFKTEIAENR